MARTAQTHRVEFIRRLLTEGVSTPDMSMLAGTFGLAAGNRYRAFRAQPRGGQSASTTLREILQWATAHQLSPIGAVMDGYAVGVLADTSFSADGPSVGIGVPTEMHRLHESFRSASQAMEVAIAFGRSGPQTLDELSLQVAVAAEHAVGDNLVERILGPLIDRDAFGQELIASLDAFLASDMNSGMAANLLVVHPNTLRYRINLVKEYCGLSLKSAREISEVWWALRRYEWSRNTGHGRTA
jgi:PucR C-terminal helix-turn-helix domain